MNFAIFGRNLSLFLIKKSHFVKKMYIFYVFYEKNLYNSRFFCIFVG